MAISRGQRHFNRKFKSFIADELWVQKNVKRYDYRTAERRKGPLYAVLVKQLFEDNCLLTAKYFQYFVLKEKQLRDDLLITHTLIMVPHILTKAMDYMTEAETAANSNDVDGMYKCLVKLYETQVLIVPLHTHYDWLVKDLHRIFIKVAENHTAMDVKTVEVKSKIFCAYAIFLTNEDINYENCVKYFNMSLELCHGEDWSAEGLSTTTTKYSSLHEYVAVQMTKAFTKYAKIAFSKNDTQWALQLLRQAIIGLGQVKNFTQNVLLLDTYFCRIRYLFNIYNYQTAYDDIEIVEKKYMDLNLGKEYGRLTCEFILLKTMAQNELKRQDEVALKKFTMALTISRKYSVKTIEAQTLLQIAKLYMKYHLYQDKAKAIFLLSKKVFGALKDYTNRNIALYNSSDITAKQHFKELKKVLIESEFSLCALNKLKWWVYRGVPFWEELTKTESQMNLDIFDDITSTTRTHLSNLFSYFKMKPESELDCILEENYLKKF